MRLQLAALAMLLAPSIPRPVGACSLAPPDNGTHTVDAAETADVTAPGAVVASFEVEPGSSDDSAGCGGGASKCGGSISPRIAFVVSATDDRTRADRLGYKFRVVGGQAPLGLALPTDAVRAFDGGRLHMSYSPDVEAFVFDLEVRAVDLNGNLGPATVITISD